MGIKDFLPEQASFCEYTWKVVVYMVMTSESCMDLDIWLIRTEDMILIT